MVYGHYVTDTAGNKQFFTEGCSYCQMSTGGQHEPSCPYFKDKNGFYENPCHKVSGNLISSQDISNRLQEIREDTYRKYRKAWQGLSQL